MRADQEDVKRMIRDTVSLLCRNTLSHDVGIRIQGLVGITVDDSQVFLVQFDESFGSDVSSSESGKVQSVDGVSSPNTLVAQPSKTDARKRRRLSETTDPSAACNTSGQHSVAAGEDCDVIFVADDSDSNVKFEFDEFCNSVNEYNCNYIPTGNGSRVFKTEDVLAATDLNVITDDRETQKSQVQHGSARNTLLRSMLASENNYMSDEVTCWQSPVYSEEMNMQTCSVRHEQTTARPRIKQVVIWFIVEFEWFTRNGFDPIPDFTSTILADPEPDLIHHGTHGPCAVVCKCHLIHAF